MLPFVAGLGIRKARELRRVLETHLKVLHNREDLKRIAELGDVVFQNCNAFLSRKNRGNSTQNSR